MNRQWVANADWGITVPEDSYILRGLVEGRAGQKRICQCRKPSAVARDEHLLVQTVYILRSDVLFRTMAGKHLESKTEPSIVAFRGGATFQRQSKVANRDPCQLRRSGGQSPTRFPASRTRYMTGSVHTPQDDLDEMRSFTNEKTSHRQTPPGEFLWRQKSDGWKRPGVYAPASCFHPVDFGKNRWDTKKKIVVLKRTFVNGAEKCSKHHFRSPHFGFQLEQNQRLRDNLLEKNLHSPVI